MRSIVVIWFFLVLGSVRSQNLVPNPSFELNDSCYTINSSQAVGLETAHYLCSEWFSFEDSLFVHYFNPCNYYYFSAPQNYAGHSWAYEGDSYIGFVFFQGLGIDGEKLDHRGFLSAKLLDSMYEDSAYCISYRFKNSGVNNNTYGIDNIGILFTEDTLSQFVARTSQPSLRTPKGVLQFENDWITYSGVYIANGQERFINIGTFGDDNETQYSFEGHNWIFDLPAAHYYYDFIEVYKCNKDSIFNVRLGELPNVITPNGDNINDFYEFDFFNFESLTIRVVNRWGVTVTEIDGLSKFWDGRNSSGNNVADGVYYIFVEGTDIYGNHHSKTSMVHVLR